MTKQTKIRALVFFLVLAVSLSGFAQVPDLTDLQNGVADFSEGLAKSLAFNSSIGLNWSDAYIGKLFPGLPPHFGVGVALGFTTMDLPVIKTLAGYLGYELPGNMNRLPLPAYTVEARVGGLFLPFDVGFKFGYLPPLELFSVKTNYLLVGGDIRYALLDKPALPKISIGIGLNYLKGGIGAKVGSGTTLSYGSDSITIESPEIGFDWKSVALDFKAQISYSLLILTPYAGIGGSYAWSDAGYSVDSRITQNGTPLTQAEIDVIDAYLKNAGVAGVDVSASGISSIIENNAFSFRAFGGLSINLAVLRLDLTGLYSFLDKNFGASFGIRFQL